MFECHGCGIVIDRDFSAAINILNLGLEQALAEEQPLLVKQRISKFASVKQEADVRALVVHPARLRYECGHRDSNPGIGLGKPES